MFIERDGDLFQTILDFCRSNQRPPENKLTRALVHECQYFQCDSLAHIARGEINPYDLSPENRRLLIDEAAARANPTSEYLIDLFKTEITPLTMSELGVPSHELLLDGGTPPRLQATCFEDFYRRLDCFSGGLLEELKDIPGLVIAGGSVLSALVGCAAHDVDIFLTCEETAQSTFRQIDAAVRRNQMTRSQGARSKVLVTRTLNAVTFYPVCGSRVGKGAPPVQVILSLARNVTDLLVNFDVDCACFAFVLDAKRIYTIPRGLRALRSGVNFVVDTRFHGGAYAARLAKYAYRDFAVVVPGYDPERVAEKIASSTYVYFRNHDLLVRLKGTPDALDPTREICLDVPRPEGGAHRIAVRRLTSTVLADVVRGFERLVVQHVTKTRLDGVDVPYLLFNKRVSYTSSDRTCVPIPTGNPGEFKVLWGRHPSVPVPTTSGDEDDAEYIIVNDETINRLLRFLAHRTLMSDEPEDGGGALLAQDCRSPHALVEYSGFIYGPVFFLYDLVSEGELRYVIDGARKPLEDLPDDKFKERYRIHRRLVFVYREPREVLERPMFFRGVYV